MNPNDVLIVISDPGDGPTIITATELAMLTSQTVAQISALQDAHGQFQLTEDLRASCYVGLATLQNDYQPVTDTCALIDLATRGAPAHDRDD